MISPVSILPPMDFKDHLSSWYVGDKTWDTFCKINIKNKIHLLSPLSSLLFPSDCAYIYIYISSVSSVLEKMLPGIIPLLAVYIASRN